MDRLKKSRAPVRALFTKHFNLLEIELAVQDPNHDVVVKSFKNLQTQWEKLQGLDDAVKEAMLDEDCSEDLLGVEMEAADSYATKWVSIGVEVEKITKHLRSPSPSEITGASGTSAAGMKRSFKLPKIELKKFNGELKEWLSFWSQFQKIDEDETLHVTDKFQYLLQSLQLEPLELAKSYPQTAENYPKVIDALKARFGRDGLLVQVYVRELLKLVITNVTKREKTPLAQMVLQLQSHLRALASLKLATMDPSTWLFPLVESSLPEELLRAWQRSPLSKKDGSSISPLKSNLDYLMDFLMAEMQSEQQIELAQSGFENFSVKEKDKPKNYFQSKTKKGKDSDIPTAAGLFSGHSGACIFCEKPHESRDCGKAVDMSLVDKNKKVQEKRACFGCLKVGHNSTKCKSFVKCVLCKKKHFTVMCPEAHKKVEKTIEGPAVETSSGLNCTTEVMLQTLNVLLIFKGRQKSIRVICDNGSQRSYILRKTVEDLSLESCGKIKLCHYLFGGSTELKEHEKYNVQIESECGDEVGYLEVLETTRICGAIPRMKSGRWMGELKRNNIWIKDIGSGTPDIELLIGSDYYGQILTGNKFELQNGLVAIETKFGWTLSGKISNQDDVAMSVTSMHVQNAEISDLWNLELIGIQDPAEHKTKQEREEETRKHFLRTVSRSKDGRYCVKLPWTSGRPQISNNRAIAESRLMSATIKLEAQGKFELYGEIFKSWLKEGFIETVDQEKVDDHCHYLPHRPVFKPSSLTTPVRPVFDASCKSKRSPSLNDCLEKGPNLLELIPEILLRFRENRIAFTSDIRKAFQMIEVSSDDRDMQRFLWWENLKSKEIRVYRHRRVVFGVNCSPYLLAAVLDHHLKNVDENLQGIAKKLLRSLYVDNCVTSVNSLEDYEAFRDKSTQLMADAKMELREWECSVPPIMNKPVIPVLGISWHKEKDVLFCDFSNFEVLKQITKRKILSITHQIFDPIGFTAPALIRPKLLLQEAWAAAVDWDTEMSEEFSSEFVKWYWELPCLKLVSIPRWINPISSQNLAIHTFCDASQDAYAAVVYLRGRTDQNTIIRFLQAKSRIAPLKRSRDKNGVQLEKRTSIPRLELLACTIGARLTHATRAALDFEEVPCYFWSDSTTALAWIRRNDNWGTFVGNRVREILQLTNPNDWRHVPGIYNPADLPSRGCSPQQLMESRWWEGPEWLLLNPDEWPVTEEMPDEEEINGEVKKTTRTLVTSSYQPLFKYQFSNYLKNIRVVAWVRRYVKNLKALKGARKNQNFIDIKETREAEKVVLHSIQSEAFPNGVEDLKSLKVRVGPDGLIRVDTKLTYKTDSVEFRHPIVLPKTHVLVDQLIQLIHVTNCHAGAQFVLGRLRENYWVLQGRKAVKRIIQCCVVCKRYAAEKFTVEPAPLPMNRVEALAAYQTTGVDLAGPLFLKEGNKAWITLFTCAVYRTIHLDLVTSLSTEAFLGALERFININGRPNTIYSDNGTNFVGAVNLFKKLDWRKIEKESNTKQIQWIFNPPTAAWWGGWWERLVRSVKDLLRRMLGRARLTLDELRTCLSAVEATINSRPLTTITEDQDDLIPLTPAMFTRGLKLSKFPEAPLVSSRDFQSQYKRIQDIKSDLQARFRREYLALLVQKSQEKPSKTPNIGDVVLVGADNKKRFEWPMGRIMELYPGKDGNIRVATVKTRTGIVKRPLQRLFSLEIPSVSSELSVSQDIVKVAMDELAKKDSQDSDNSTEPEAVKVVKTKFGRKIIRPNRYGHWK